MMKLCWTTIQVADLERSLEFYHDILGLEVASRSPEGPSALAMLGPADQPKLELLRTGQPVPEGNGRGVSVGFQVEDLDQAVRELEAKGVTVLRGPISPNPHIRFSFISDPDGYEVQLVEER